MLATLVPTILMTALGIVLLAIGAGTIPLIFGILVIVFCTTAITGYILGSIFVSRGASMARVQNDFLSAVSHELRTPLTSIGLFLETLRDERLTDPAEKDKCFSLLNQEVARLSGLVERLLELSRIETGKQIYARAPVKVADLVSDAITAFDAATMAEPVSVACELADPELAVIGDRASLAQALLNLLTNAWKYTPVADKQIRIVAATAQKRNRVEISVLDNGPGVPRGEQKQIFEKFERGRSAIDSRTEGIGLGLATVVAIVRANRGTIELRSRGGQGSEFRLLLRKAPP